MNEKQKNSAEAAEKCSMRLVLQRGVNAGKVFHVAEGSNLIGRWDVEAGAFPEIDLEDDDEEAKVSRKHAVVLRAGNSAELKDVGSLNGTFVNDGPRLDPGNTYPLKHGDTVVVGKTILRFEIDEA